MTVAAWILAALIASASLAAVDSASDRVEQARALKCARASDGADSSIADCYAKFSQPCPDDICPM